MSVSRAPEIIVVDDIAEYDLDGKMTDPQNRAPYLEPFIHAEIYRARPDVRAVVHGHTPVLAAFSTSNIPLRPLLREAAFIGERVPVFKNGDAGDEVRSPEPGRRLAATLGQGGAVLLHGHGAVVVASSLPSLMGRAIGLHANAQQLALVLAMGDEDPIYLRPNPGSGRGAVQGSPGGNNSKQWEAYEHRTAISLRGDGRDDSLD
jgi:HCOMODA/2-hydroxy-3-carboxy-muconic semialdehyde decarboxylase